MVYNSKGWSVGYSTSKGEISLTLTETGQGVTLGVSVGSLIIRPKPA